MKKVLIILISFLMLISIGCSKQNKSTYNDSPYTYETAIKNGDVVAINGKQHNTEKLEQFLENVENDKKDKIRIVQYTTEGGAIITDLEYSGNKIKYAYDRTRDGFGLTTIEKKKFNADSLYKKGSRYYLKSTPDDIWIY